MLPLRLSQISYLIIEHYAVALSSLICLNVTSAVMVLHMGAAWCVYFLFRIVGLLLLLFVIVNGRDVLATCSSTLMFPYFKGGFIKLPTAPPMSARQC